MDASLLATQLKEMTLAVGFVVVGIARVDQAAALPARTAALERFILKMDSYPLLRRFRQNLFSRRPEVRAARRKELR